MLKDVFIYALVDPDTEDVRYVGKSTDPEARLEQHREGSGQVRRWLKSLGGRDPIVVILDRVPGHLWQHRERFWIAKIREESAPGVLLNVLDGGQGWSAGVSQAPEHRAKIAEKNRARWQDPEYRARMLKALDRTGKSHRWSDAERRAQSERLTGKKRGPLTDEHKQKLRAARLGKPATNQSEEARRKMSKARRLWHEARRLEREAAAAGGRGGEGIAAAGAGEAGGVETPER